MSYLEVDTTNATQGIQPLWVGNHPCPRCDWDTIHAFDMNRAAVAFRRHPREERAALLKKVEKGQAAASPGIEEAVADAFQRGVGAAQAPGEADNNGDLLLFDTSDPISSTNQVQD